MTNYVHPQLLLSLSDQAKRYDSMDACEKATVSRPVGFVLGSLNKEENDAGSLFIGIELTQKECMNRDHLLRKIRLLNEIYGQGYLEIVGIYTVRVEQGESLLAQRSDDMIQLRKLFEVTCQSSGNSVGIMFDGRHSSRLMNVVFNYKGENFELHITNALGQPMDWEIRSISPEEASINTFKSARKCAESNGDDHKDIISNLQSLNSDIGVMIDFVSEIQQGSINISHDKEASEELSKIVQVARKIQYIRNVHESEPDEESTLEKLASLSSVCVSVLNENMQLSSRMQNELHLLREEVGGDTI